MSHKFLLNASFHKNLEAMDYDLAEQERVKGCKHCGGTLHRADYPRSPMGMPIALREHYQERYSYCCDRCRKRTTSPSLRFFGRRWFPHFLHLLISAFIDGAARSLNKRREQLHRLFGITISKRTCKRWKYWWQETFVRTSFWRWRMGIIPISRTSGPLPQQLFCMTLGEQDTPSAVSPPFKQRLLWVLEFLAPITAGVFRGI